MTLDERRTEVTDEAAPTPLALTYIIGTYPLLTTTFIDREIRTLRERGVDARVVSIRRPGHELSAEQEALAAITTYVMPVGAVAVAISQARFVIRRPIRYLTTLIQLVAGRRQSRRQRVRTVGHFALGVHVAALIEHDRVPERLHAHFVDRAAVVALVVGRLLDVPYGVTAHANDIYVDPVLLTEKLQGADLVATCTGFNESHLRHEVPAAADGRIALVYHGLDVGRYQPSPSDREYPPLMLAVGQLKEKKGFADLLVACRRLADQDVPFRCEIVGEGPLRSALEQQIADLGLGGRVTLLGARPHDEVVDAYRRASLFVLPCVVAGDGDRDGIPNVILEAMAMALPVVSTDHSGIPEVVEDNINGRLVPPGDPDTLAEAIAGLLGRPADAQAMGQRGRELVVNRFDVDDNVGELHRRIAALGDAR